MPALEYPVFDEPFGRSLDACAQLKTRDRKILSHLATVNKAPHRGRVGKGSAAEYFSILGGGGEKASKRHLHITVASSKYFKKRPQKNDSIPKIADAIRVFFGQRVAVNVTARFVVPIDSLPVGGAIRASLSEGIVSGMPIRQTAAGFTIGHEGSETEILVFRSRDDAQIELEFASETVIDSTYLRRLHHEAYAVFLRLIFEGINPDVEAEST